MYANVEQIDKETIKIDLHGLFVHEAEAILQQEITSCDKGIGKIVVVHGYKNGDNIKQMIRSVRNGRISHIYGDFYNKGQSIIVLKK